MATKEFWGIEMQIIKDLGDGWSLAAHPNGPVILSEHSLTTLGFCGYEPGIKEQDDDFHYLRENPEIEDDGIPFTVRRAAIEAYVNWSWPTMKKTLEPQ